MQKGAGLSDLPNVVPAALEVPDFSRLNAPNLQHKPRILMLYGSLRERSFSRFLAYEAARLLEPVYRGLNDTRKLVDVLEVLLPGVPVATPSR